MIGSERPTKVLKRSVALVVVTYYCNHLVFPGLGQVSNRKLSVTLQQANRERTRRFNVQLEDLDEREPLNIHMFSMRNTIPLNT
jgi:hypothetical protein